MRPFIATTLVFLLAACAQPYGNRPLYLTPMERQAHEAGTKIHCINEIKIDQNRKTWPSDRQDAYCSCAAKRSAETVTLPEIEAYNLAKQNPAAIRPHIDSVASYCMERLLQVWLPPLLASEGLVPNGKLAPGTVYGGSVTAEDIERVIRKHNLYFSGPAK